MVTGQENLLQISLKKEKKITRCLYKDTYKLWEKRLRMTKNGRAFDNTKKKLV